MLQRKSYTLIMMWKFSSLTYFQAKLKSKEATCMTVSTWIGIGTRNGLVLVFDITQNLKWFLDTLDVLGTKNSRYIYVFSFFLRKIAVNIYFKINMISSESPEWGNAISAMAFNCDHTRLLVGNACGHILEYDMKDGKLVRTLNDVHPPEAAILHLKVPHIFITLEKQLLILPIYELKFTDQPSLALLCDSGGNVFELGFKRTLGVRGVDTRCLFSGSRGEVCIIEPLRSVNQDSSVVFDLYSKWEPYIIVAMATLSKVPTSFLLTVF